MGWWMVLFWVVTAFLGRLLTPRPKIDQRPPSAAGEFELPTNDESRAISVGWGTFKVRGPNIVWSGNFFNLPYSIQGITYYKYFWTLHAAICHGPVTAVRRVFVDDKPQVELELVEATPHFNHHRYHIKIGNDPEPKGSHTGHIWLYRGAWDQPACPEMEASIGVPLPGFRGLCYAYMPDWFVGEEPYIPGIGFEVERCPNPLGLLDDRHKVQGESAGGFLHRQDSNPACILYEILTDTHWGLGLPEAQIDTASFVEAADTLYAEGLGLSMLVESTQEAGDLINEVLCHVDGAIFTHPLTGLVTMDLVRADYVAANTPLFDESCVSRVELVRPGWGETKSTVMVKYLDRANDYTERVVVEHDAANYQLRGGIRAIAEVQYLGAAKPGVALALAVRDLKAVSYPFARVTIETDRRAWALCPASVIRLNWPDLSLSGLLLRVVRVRPGEPRDGKVLVEAVEDAFAVEWTGHMPLRVTEWVDPTGVLGTLETERLEETPYAVANGAHRRAMALAVRGTGWVSACEIWSDAAGGTNYTKTNPAAPLTPAGLLRGVMGWTSQEFQIESCVDAALLATIDVGTFSTSPGLCLVGDEIVAWRKVTDNGDGTLTISGCRRGAMDTTPAPHASGSRVWFFSHGRGPLQDDPYASDGAVAAKLLPYNAKATLPIAQAARQTIDLASRALRPYVPTDVKINGVAYPKAIAGDLVLTWEHRDRLGTWVYDDSGRTSTPEDGTTYAATVWGLSGADSWGYAWGNKWGGTADSETQSGLTGKTATFVDPPANPRVTLEAIVAGLGSRQVFDYTVGDNGGFGLNWGNDYGG